LQANLFFPKRNYPTVFFVFSLYRSKQAKPAIFMPIAYLLGVTKRRRKYVEEKTTATLTGKQTSDHHAPKPSSNNSQPLDPFHFSLPTTYLITISFGGLKADFVYCSAIQ
jgi:hypothetical protein